MNHLKRICVHHLKRAGLLVPGESGFVDFRDGTRANVRCVRQDEIEIDYLGRTQTVRIVRVSQRLGERSFFVANGNRRVAHLYWFQDIAFASRHAKALQYRRKDFGRALIPEFGSGDARAIAGEVLR